MAGKDRREEEEALGQFKASSQEKKNGTGFSLYLAFKFVVIFLIPTLLLSAGITNSVLVAKSKQHSITLAIASDVIECASPSTFYKFSTIVVTEIQFDIPNDNPEGLTMDLFTLREADIIYHKYVDTYENYELVLPTSGPSRFIMPYNYYNRPWYLWSGSTIRIEFKLAYKEKPTKVELYLFKGEKRIESFVSKNVDIPFYEEHVDLLLTDRNNMVFWQVQENDYYYIAVDTVASKDTIFQSNITFDLKYIDVEDYPWLVNTSERAMGVNQSLTLHHSLSSPNINRTLCYMHPIPPSDLVSNRIHLNTVYFIDVSMKLILLIIPFGLLTLHIISLLGWLLVSKIAIICHHKSRKDGYMAIN